MKVTIRDIARECKVSPFTVSSVINNKRSISEETKARVREAINRLGYDPAQNAPHVRNKKVRSIGLVVPVIADDHNWFFNRAITAAKQATYAAGLGYKLMSEGELAEMVLDNAHAGSAQLQCDAVIILTPWQRGMDCVDRLRSWNIPVALIRRSHKGRGVIMLSDDDRQGTTMALEHLAAQGHRTIAYVTTGFGSGDIPGRREAYHSFVRERGLTDNPRLVMDEEVHGRDVGTYLLKLRADGLDISAVFCTVDNIAARVIKTCLKKGLRVPEDVAVAGYDDDQIARDFYPSITSVHVPVEEMTAEAVRALDAFNPETSASAIELKFENRLEIRESTAGN